MPRSPRSGRSGDEILDKEEVVEAKVFEGETPETIDGCDQPAPWKALFYFTTKSHISPLLCGLASALISGIASPAQSLLLGKAFGLFTTYAAGGISSQDLLSRETKYIYYMLAVGGASWAIHFVFFTSWLTFGELQAKSARDRLFNGMLRKDLEWYDLRKNGIGAMTSRLQIQIRDLQLATSQPLGSLFTIGANACFSFGLAMYYSWKLTLVIISTVPVMTVILGILGAQMQQSITKHQAKLTAALKHITCALNSIDTVKCFNGQFAEATKYGKEISEAALRYYRTVNINAQQAAFTQFVGSAMFVQAFYYGSVLVDSGQKSTGDVVTTFMSAIGAFSSISGIIGQMLVLEKGRTAGVALREVMLQIENNGSAPSPGRYPDPTDCSGKITFKDVSFAYPTRSEQMALQNITLSIPSGEFTFVIGRSGSGKSTLGQLLMRFYSLSSGQIKLDDVPIYNLDPTWLRRNITLVEQSSVLFQDTIFHNVALGRDVEYDVTHGDVLQATEFALLQQTINELPLGVHTRVERGGNSLSGGQKQRMALARAWLRDTPVLILDESTSALDHISRELMLDAIRVWRKGRTTIVITHDITQIQANDYAYVLEQGQLVQEGYRKHMERFKDSPFQAFLPTCQEPPLSPFDSRRHTEAEWSFRQETLPTPVSVTLPTESPETANRRFILENNRPVSFLSGVLLNRGIASAISASSFGSPLISWPSPWLRLIESPSPFSSISENGSIEDLAVNGDGVRNGIRPNGRSDSTDRTFRGSERLETLIQRTGDLAAQARLNSRGLPRRPIAFNNNNHTLPGGHSDTSSCIERSKRPKTLGLWSILGTVWPNIALKPRAILVIAAGFCTIHAAKTPAFSFILSKLVQTYGTGPSGKHKAMIFAMAIIGLSVIDAICVYFMHVLLEYVGQQWVDRIRAIASERILNQPKEFFAQEENSVSRLTESLDRHAEDMRNLLARFSPLVVVAAIMILVALIWALATQWKLTLIALSVGPYVYGVTRAFSAISGKWESKSNDASEEAGAIFTETITSIKTVKALVLETHFASKYSKATNNALRIGMKRALYAGFFYGLSDSSGIFTQALVFYVGARLASNGVTVTSIIQVFFMLIMTITNISTILSFIPQMSSSRDTATRLLRLSRLTRNSQEDDGNAVVPSIGDIDLVNVNFHYPSCPDQLVLRNVSLHIKTGKSIAIVGSSGSGKSTIASLLLKLYSVAFLPSGIPGEASEITLSKRDIRHIHTPTLRSLISVVSQTPTLFAASIADNISYGLPGTSPNASFTAVRAAASLAGIDDFIASLPSGYSTLVGDGGMGVSGGQAQRIAIARALIRQPDVLILDEATSALDVESAALIRSTVQSLVAGRGPRGKKMTFIIITHSREMMEIADRIVVLEQGRVVEEGGFNELVARQGELARLLSGGEWTGRASDEATGVEGLSPIVDWGGNGVRYKGKGKGKMI